MPDIRTALARPDYASAVAREQAHIDRRASAAMVPQVLQAARRGKLPPKQYR